MSKQASAAKAEEEAAVALDLTGEETVEELAEGAWVKIRLPSGKAVEARVSRAEGPPFFKTVRAVNRKWTRNGRKALEKLTDNEDFERSVEIACRACFHEVHESQLPILVRDGNKRVEIKDNKLASRIRLLMAVPALWQGVNEVVGLEADSFREVAAEVGEG